MTPFSLILKLSGLTQAEAAEFLGITPSSIDKMARGTRSTPQGVLDEMCQLVRLQQETADACVDAVEDLDAPEIEIGYPADDYEARQLGFPTVSAWMVMAARVIAEANAPVTLVPRGSTLSSAAASDAHDK